MSDLCLITHCSPTLANLKTGNLFSMDCPFAHSQVEQWNKQLNPKGIFARIIQRTGGRCVIYVYRREMLDKDLHSTEIQEFLASYGYDDFTPDGAINRLCSRMRFHDDFPHEIGAFLSYPLNDILGFIENKGQNCKLCGIWKVYDDVEGAQRQFTRFKKCRDVYTRMWKSGKSAYQLAVPTR